MVNLCCTRSFCQILASAYGPGPYDAGPLGPYSHGPVKAYSLMSNRGYSQNFQNLNFLYICVALL